MAGYCGSSESGSGMRANPKLEIRNPKQISNPNDEMFQTEPTSSLKISAERYHIFLPFFRFGRRYVALLSFRETIWGATVSNEGFRCVYLTK
jgi:hypothetical protein